MIAALVTLIRLHGQNNIKFVRIMMFIILFTSIAEIFIGIEILHFISLDVLVEKRLKLYIALQGTFVILYDLGAWTIIWHVSFKYWETARQFSRMVRMYQ